MKKILIMSFLLITSVCCFAHEIKEETKIEQSEKQNQSKDTAIFFDIGRTGYPTNEYELFLPPINLQEKLWSDNTFFEVGKFNSRERGFLNWVNWHLGGFGFGGTNTEKNYGYIFSGDTHVASENARLYKLWERESFGLQASFFHFSAGALIGLKSYIEYTKFETINVTQNNAYPNSIYRGVSAGLDFSPTTYLSFNLAKIAKIFVLYNIDLPVFALRFVTTDSIGPEYKSKAKAQFFKGDHPSSVMVGACIFL